MFGYCYWETGQKQCLRKYYIFLSACNEHVACICACVIAHDCCVYENVPVLAVLSVVTVLTVTDISMRGAGLPVTLCLILTWVKLTCIHTAFTIESCI